MIIDRVLLISTLSLAIAGCNDGSLAAPRTVPTSGTVLVKGKPTEGVKVTLHPRFEMTFRPNGVTNKAGQFILSTAAPVDGAPPGEYAVTFELIRAGTDKRGLDIELDVWKGKYANLDTAPVITVGSSETTLEPFRLD